MVVVEPVAERLDFVGRYLACEGVRTVLLGGLEGAAEQAALMEADAVLVSADAAMVACVDTLSLAASTGRPTAILSPSSDLDAVVSWARAAAGREA